MSEEIAQGLDEKKLNSMKLLILKLEHDNLKTHEKPTDAMIESIRKIIIQQSDRSF